MLRRVWLVLTAMVSLVLVILLVTSAPPDVIKKQNGRTGGQIIIGVSNDVDSFNPLYAETALAHELNHLSLLGLADLDQNSEWVPELATSWQLSQDKKKLTYYLRADAVWSDGMPVSAHDVKFTYDLLRNPETASPRQETLAYIESVIVEDSLTVSFVFHNAYPGYLYDTAGEILPKHLLQEVAARDLRTHPFSQQPLSSGPFLLKSRVPQQYIEYTPNERYFANRPFLDRVIFKIVPNNTNLLLQLANGEIDMMLDMPPEAVQGLLEKNPDIRIYPVSGRVYYYMGYNLRKKLFADAAIRRALTMAVDRQGIIAALLFGYGSACQGPLAPMLEKRQERAETLPYAPAKARTALADAGWVDSDADGWLDKAGETFEFTILTNTGNTLRSDVGVILQAQLAEVGIKANITTLERSTQIKQLRSGNFDAYLGGWSTSMLVDLTPIFHSSATSMFNFGHYHNSEVDRLIELGREELDPVQARSIWREVEDHIYRDQPYTFLFWKDRVVGVHARFQDVTPVALSAVYGLENWYQSKQED